MNETSGRKLLIDGEKLAFGKNPKRKILSEIMAILKGTSDTFPDSRAMTPTERTKLAGDLREKFGDFLDVIVDGLWDDNEDVTTSSIEIDGHEILVMKFGEFSFLFQENGEAKMLEFRGVAGS